MSDIISDNSLKAIAEDIINRYGYNIAKGRFGVETLVKVGLSKPVDTFFFLASKGCVVSTKEDGSKDVQRIDDPVDFAMENDLKFTPPLLNSDSEAKQIAFSYNIGSNGEFLTN